MFFKIFLYFLYIISLSIYKNIEYYISKGNLAQVVSGWTPNLLVWGSNPLGSKQMGSTVARSGYFSMKYRVETLRYMIFRRYIAKISRHFLPWKKMKTVFMCSTICLRPRSCRDITIIREEYRVLLSTTIFFSLYKNTATTPH